jgi:hypothetical protein
MKALFILFFLVIYTLSLTAQSVDYNKHIPNKHGVTYHFIHEDKIQLFQSANDAQDHITSYKRGITIGYTEVGLGVGALVFAGCFMDVPLWWSDGRYDSSAKRRRNARYVVSAIGSALVIDGALRIGRNHKKLSHIQWHLTPTTGGVRFVF